MSKCVINVDNVTKKFRLPHERRDTLKERILHFHRRLKYTDFYAVKDVDMSIHSGEFIGIVGKNGSGKSTLLKLMAHIYKPTKGTVIVDGSVSPFLDLGVGFNHELSAKENVYLNATILGLTKKEIDKKYPEIVSFAELEDFMEVKLKNFSSGMQVRLAFSVAAQTDADIYLCDEVLAVGDISFQKKCLKVFRQLKKQGKTIVYVSHDLDSIRQFSDRVFYLKDGKIEKEGDTNKVLEKYLQDSM